jgi:GDP-mannose pyrophosphatase NudK
VGKDSIRSTQTVFTGYFDVLKVDIEGVAENYTRFIIQTKRAAAILLYNTASDTVILVKQNRIAVSIAENLSQPFLEIPAGTITKNEDITEGIIREVYEETGYKITEAKKVMSVYSSPGITTEQIHIYFAQINENQRQGTGGGLADEHEHLEVLEIKVSEAIKMIQEGDITDSKTIIALQWLMLQKDSNQILPK